MLQHVFERAEQARYLTRTIIATDDERVYHAARAFGAPVRMTRADHVSGTDRVAEAVSAEEAEIVVNIQGDEPLIDPDAIDAAVLPMVHEPGVLMATLKKKIEDPREVTDPNVVKVVTNHEGDAIYFSRNAIPFYRDGADSYVRQSDHPDGGGRSRNPDTGHGAYYKHVGLYVYRRDFLLSYPALPVGPLETAEKLEQLRALENGFSIRVVETEYESFGVDTPEDLQRVNDLLSSAAEIAAGADDLHNTRPRAARRAPSAAALKE